MIWCEKGWGSARIEFLYTSDLLRSKTLQKLCIHSPYIKVYTIGCWNLTTLSVRQMWTQLTSAYVPMWAVHLNHSTFVCTLPPRCSGLEGKARFLPGNLIYFTPRGSELRCKSHFYHKNQWNQPDRKYKQAGYVWLCALMELERRRSMDYYSQWAI